jgi:hypothetical protein
MSYWYLATPYSKYKDGHEAAYKEAARVCAGLIKNGEIVFSPIVHCHALVADGGLTITTWAQWSKYDLAMIDSAKGLLVCEMDGWEESVGVQDEIKYAIKLGKPVVYFSPKNLTLPRIV